MKAHIRAILLEGKPAPARTRQYNRKTQEERDTIAADKKVRAEARAYRKQVIIERDAALAKRKREKDKRNMLRTRHTPEEMLAAIERIHRLNRILHPGARIENHPQSTLGDRAINSAH